MFNGQIFSLPANGVVDGPFIPRPSPGPTPTPAPTPDPTPTPTPDPTPTPSPSGPGQVDGLWIGTIDSSSYSNVAAGAPLIFWLRNGALVFPGTVIPFCGGFNWPGGVDSNGIAQFNNSVSAGGGRETCSVSGVFSGAGGTASGTFSVTWTGAFPETGGGRWSATRVPGVARVPGR